MSNIFQFAWNSSYLFTEAVPDEETAIIIAQAVLVAMGEEDILSPRPSTVGRYCSVTREIIEPPPSSISYYYLIVDVTFNRLKGAWVVSTCLPISDDLLIMGTSPEVVIRRSDARIMSVKFR